MGNKCYSYSNFGSETKPEEFISKHNARNNNLIDNASLVDQRRVVFVSFVGLYSTWRNCPSVVLYSSIFIVPLKEEWIDEPVKYAKQIEDSCPANSRFYEDKEFIQLLKWKNSQGLVFWVMNDFTSEHTSENNINPLVSPFWDYFNKKLQTLYDPITGGTYKCIEFEEQWWQNNYNKTAEHMSQFEVSLSLILCELYFVQQSKKYRAMKEILYQSNPLSLNPIISYNDYDWKYMPDCTLHIKKVSDEQLDRIDECENEKDDAGEWCIVDGDLYASNEEHSFDQNIF